MRECSGDNPPHRTPGVLMVRVGPLSLSPIEVLRTAVLDSRAPYLPPQRPHSGRRVFVRRENGAVYLRL